MQTSDRSCDERQEQVSHGICSKCLIILESRIREKPDYSVPLPGGPTGNSPSPAANPMSLLKPKSPGD